MVGLPLLLWTISGLVMVSRPWAEVRSEKALRPAAPLPAEAVVPPRLARGDIVSLTLAADPGGERWRIGYADGSAGSADARTGVPLGPIDAAEATAAALARYTGTAHVTGARMIDRRHAPRELGRPVDAWQVTLDDGLHLYVDAYSGEVLAARSRWWRIYDWFWGLHIMDLQGRQNPNNPWIITFTLLSLASLVVGIALLPGATRRLLRPKAK